MRKKHAFSLIELVVVMIILGILVAIGAPLVFKVADAWVFQKQRKEMSESAKIGMDRMIREIRRIKDSMSVLTANSSTFQFIDIDDQNITLDLSGSSLRRTLAGSANILADNVSALSFIYYDENGIVIATPLVSPNATDIKRIQISLTFSLAGQGLSFQSQVVPRRLE